MTNSLLFRHLLCSAALLLTAMSLPVWAQDDPGGQKFPITTATGESQEPAAEVLAAGSLAIQAVQGTEGGEPIGSLPVQIDLISNNQIVQTINTSLDEFGVVVISDLPVEQGIRPLVRIDFGEVKYQQFGALMDAASPQQRIRMICYETTEVTPDWEITLRQVMVVGTPHGIKVTELVFVKNPTTLTWIGVGTGKPAARTRSTITFALPRHAENITLGKGFLSDAASIESTAINNHLPLMPGENEYSYSYTIHADTEGELGLVLPQAGRVNALMVIVPEAIPVDQLQGLEYGGEHQIDSTRVRYYQAFDLRAGQSLGLKLSGFEHSDGVPLSRESATLATTADTRGSVQLVTVIGMVLLLLGGVVLILAMKSKGTASAKKE